MPKEPLDLARHGIFEMKKTESQRVPTDARCAPSSFHGLDFPIGGLSSHTSHLITSRVPRQPQNHFHPSSPHKISNRTTRKPTHTTTNLPKQPSNKMMFKTSTLALLLASAMALLANNDSTFVAAHDSDNEKVDDFDTPKATRRLKSSSSPDGPQSLIVRVTNLAFRQPFSGLFVMVHTRAAGPLFTLGMPASAALGTLAENGDPSALVTAYNGQPGVATAMAVPGPIGPGASLNIPVTVPAGYYVTIATMAVNTNDCFVALNGAKISPGDMFRGVGYDSGTEVNNQQCDSIPGPACPAGNNADGNGEGFVHIHRGIQSDVPTNTLPNIQNYDWRNPMVQFRVMSA